VARSERDNYKEYLTKLFQQEEELNVKEAEVLVRQKELDKTKADLLSEMERQRELLTDRTDFVRSMEKELIEDEELLEGKRREIFRISEELSNLRNDQSRLQSSFEGLKHKEASSIKDAENLKKILSEIESSLRDIESSLLKKNNDLSLFNEKKQIIAEELSTSKNRIEGLRETLSRLKEDLASYTSRVDSLREIILDGPKKELLSEDLNLNLLASISDVIEIETEYEKAIEGMLSEKVNSFILSSFNDIEIAISALKEKGAGRTAFIPVNPTISEKIDLPEGAIGRALSFVRTREEFSGVAKSLFENIFIVRDLKAARNLIAAGHNLFFVTLDGEVIEPSGAVIAGKVKGVFRRKREIRELETTIENNKTIIDRLQAELNSIQQLVERKESDLRNIESTIVEIEKEVSLLKLTVENYGKEKERKDRRLAYLSIEIEQIIKEKELTEKLLKEKDAEVQLVDSKRGGLEQDSASLQEEIIRRRSNLEGYRAEVTDLRLSITSLKERIDSVNKEGEAVLRELAEVNQKKEFLSADLSSTKSRISQYETEIEAYEVKIRSLLPVADELRMEISERKEEMETENQELLTSEYGLKLLRNQIDSISQRIAEIDIYRAEHKLKIDNVRENIRQNYGSDLETINVEPFTIEDEKRLIELREKVQELGPVNLGTLEEYEELRVRYEFLTTQQGDLNRSIAELEEAITRINISTRRRLREAFDALNAKFSEVFLILFGGGRAKLVMTDENNILETGIDIIAQPPGKKLQNINLLSGGEKALTALSLLFASFLIKPTPLCILDEADSALDELSIERFAKMLQELSKDTQFIVVTHNRNTISVADYIYGITMEEAGVSKVISMQLVEA
jgi:chromosome segregation protein